ncbi:MAG: single-stranded DNA-binding protein [Saccharofermentanales bacterium]
MNKAILMGRLTRDPDLRTTPAQVTVATFTLAVDRRFKNASGEKQADFIPVVAWRNNADFVGKYCKKGSKLVVTGSIQTRTYDDKEGRKVYVTEVVADDIEFAESKRDDSGSGYGGQAQSQSQNMQTTGTKSAQSFTQDNSDGFLAIDDDDTSLPFDL